MPVARGLCLQYPATGEQAAGLILIILKYIEIIACIPVKGERYKTNKPRRYAYRRGFVLFGNG